MIIQIASQPTNAIKLPARYTTTANITLSGTGVQAGGDWGGVLTAGDRILVKNQTTGSQNGIYVAAAGAWTRAIDLNQDSEITAGLLIVVTDGITLADSLWELTTENPIVIGTTALTFQIAASGVIGGGGTANRITKFTGATTIGNSQLFDDGTFVGFNAVVATSTEKFGFVGGTVRIDANTASTVPYFDVNKILVSSAVTPTELGYLSGVTSAIQTQLNSKWSLTGNAGTVDGTNFIGTTDDVPFNIRVNNQKAGRIDRVKFNAFFGYQAGNSNTTGTDNVAIGSGALDANTSGQYNIGIGTDADGANVTGNENIAIGYGAIKTNTSGVNNVGIGVNSLNNNVTGDNNTGVGTNALFGINDSRNTALGAFAMNSHSSGDENVAVGYFANQGGIGGQENTAVGAYALQAGTGSDNSAFGKDALFNCTTGGDNTGIGVNAGYNVSSGLNNTFLGRDAGTGITTGSQNVIIGKGTGLAAGLANVVAMYDGAGNNAFYYTGSNNYFGIGTITPNAKFHVVGALATNPFKVDTNSVANAFQIFDNGVAKGNVGLGVTSFGTNAAGVFGIFNGTAPTTSPADMFQMYSNDVVAGNAAPHIKTENGDIVKLFADNGWTAVTGTASKAGYDTATATLQQVAQTVKAMQDHLIASGFYKA